MILTKWIAHQISISFSSVHTRMYLLKTSPPLLSMSTRNGSSSSTESTPTKSGRRYIGYSIWRPVQRYLVYYKWKKIVSRILFPLEFLFTSPSYSTNTGVPHTPISDSIKSDDLNQFAVSNRKAPPQPPCISLYTHFADFEEYIALRCLGSLFSTISRRTLRHGRHHVTSLIKVYGMSGIRPPAYQKSNNGNSSSDLISSISTIKSVCSVRCVFGLPEFINPSCNLYRIGGVYPQMYFVWFSMPEDDYDVAA
eukprot:Tbor_TRINITY_DN2134_c0_g1::TRINITY_DN2134_c0_g1_i1::g.5468::m.5468